MFARCFSICSCDYSLDVTVGTACLMLLESTSRTCKIGSHSPTQLPLGITYRALAMTSEAAVATPQLWTVGHSTHDANAFAEALRRCGVARVVDVRTVPRRVSQLLAPLTCPARRAACC